MEVVEIEWTDCNRELRDGAKKEEYLKKQQIEVRPLDLFVFSVGSKKKTKKNIDAGICDLIVSHEFYTI